MTAPPFCKKPGRNESVSWRLSKSLPPAIGLLVPRFTVADWVSVEVRVPESVPDPVNVPVDVTESVAATLPSADDSVVAPGRDRAARSVAGAVGRGGRDRAGVGPGCRERVGRRSLGNRRPDPRLRAHRRLRPAVPRAAHSVYQQNDRRAAIKRRINERLGSEIIEEKSSRPADGEPPMS